MGYGRIEYLSALETYQTKENSEPYYRFMLTALNRSLKMMIDLLDIEKASEVLCSASPIKETLPEIIPPIISATDKSILIANDKISNLTDFCVTSL